MEHGCPPREGLAHAPHQREVLRAGEQPAARLPAGVDVILDVVEELRLVLDLVEDDVVAGVREKPDGVVARDVAHVRALERDVPVRGAELLAEERRLAGLTGSDDEHRSGNVRIARRMVAASARGTYGIALFGELVKSNTPYYICMDNTFGS